MVSLRRIKQNFRKDDWRSQRRSLVFNHTARDFAKEFRKNSTAMLISAFGLVAALMWQDAIRTLINSVIPADAPQNFVLKTYAAVIVTFISVVGIYIISKFKPSD